jgi:hypothetical protein
MEIIKLDLLDGGGLVQIVVGSKSDMDRLIQFMTQAKFLMISWEDQKAEAIKAQKNENLERFMVHAKNVITNHEDYKKMLQDGGVDD